MITVLDPRTNLPRHFPDAVAVCPTACPDPACQAPTDAWLCVLGIHEGEPVCIATFPPHSLYTGCNCPPEACPHLEPAEALHGPFLAVLEAAYGNPAEKAARDRAATRRQVLGLPPEEAPSAYQRLHALLDYAPHLRAHLAHMKGVSHAPTLESDTPPGPPADVQRE
jgi:hypothetical protein